MTASTTLRYRLHGAALQTTFFPALVLWVAATPAWTQIVIDPIGLDSLRGHPVAVSGPRQEQWQTVSLTLGDDPRYQSANIDVQAGQTIQFTVKNVGTVARTLRWARTPLSRASVRKNLPKEEAQEARLLHPGEETPLIWRFTQAGTAEFICNTEPNADTACQVLIDP